MKDYEIKVTQKDIDKGVSGISDSCPVALAIKRALHKKEFISVAGEHVDIGNKVVFLPKKVSNFVERFDDNKKVKPFTFTLKGTKAL